MCPEVKRGLVTLDDFGEKLNVLTFNWEENCGQRAWKAREQDVGARGSGER